MEARSGRSLKLPHDERSPLHDILSLHVLHRWYSAVLIVCRVSCQITVRAAFTDASLKAIVDERRIHNQLQPDNVDSYEEGFPAVGAAGLP